ncbi:MAG: HSP20 family small heat-shock protein [Deltaproteobacteria bacterium]|nr:HSP20 family small heat-shock protein [Deltaproteobacteria bacterium]
MSLVRKNTAWPSVPSLFGNVWAADPFRAMEEFWGREGAGLARKAASFVPSVEVKENAEGYVVKADLPGLKQEDVKITLTGNVLRIEGHRHEETTEEKDRYHVTERSYGSFARSFALPEGTNPDSVSALMKDGVLTVTIPKRPEEKPRTISISGPAKAET